MTDSPRPRYRTVHRRIHTSRNPRALAVAIGLVVATLAMMTWFTAPALASNEPTTPAAAAEETLDTAGNETADTADGPGDAATARDGDAGGAADGPVDADTAGTADPASREDAAADGVVIVPDQELEKALATVVIAYAVFVVAIAVYVVVLFLRMGKAAREVASLRTRLDALPPDGASKPDSSENAHDAADASKGTDADNPFA